MLHPYYTVILAPPIAALVGGGSVAMWRLGWERRSLSWLLPLAVAGIGILSAYLLLRVSGYLPGLAYVVGVGALAAAVALGLAISRLVSARTLAASAAVIGAVCVLAGPTAYSFSTVAHSVTGSFAAAGPASSLQQKGLGGGPGNTPGGSEPVAWAGSSPPVSDGPGAGGKTAEGTSVDKGLVEYLLANRQGAEFVVATDGAQSAQSIIIETGMPVMAMGGFSGDPWPTPAEFQKLVSAHKVRYVLVGGIDEGPGGSMPSGNMPAPTGEAVYSAPPVSSGERAPAAPDGWGGHDGGAGGSSGRATLSEIWQWVVQNGTVVDSSEYGGDSQAGTLYRLW